MLIFSRSSLKRLQYLPGFESPLNCLLYLRAAQVFVRCCHDEGSIELLLYESREQIEMLLGVHLVPKVFRVTEARTQHHGSGQRRGNHSQATRAELPWPTTTSGTTASTLRPWLGKRLVCTFLVAQLKAMI